MIPLGVMASGRVEASASGRTLTYLGDGLVNMSASTHTFTARALGNPAPGRVIVAAIGSRPPSASITSVTIGGVAATLIESRFASSNLTSIWTATVPTGTTGNIVVQWSQGSARATLGLYAINGPVTVAAKTTSIENPATMTLATTPGDLVVASVYSNSYPDNVFTWPNVTPDYTGSNLFSHASTVATGTSITFGPVMSNDVNRAAVTVAFTPA